MLKDLLKECLSLGPYPELNQPDCSKENQDKLKQLINHDIPNEIRSIINDDNFIVEGRVGQIELNWAHVPWVGIHNRNINSGAKRGVYSTILFNVKGDGLAFSLQHGCEFFTSIKSVKDRIADCQEKLEISNPSFKKQPLVSLIPADKKYTYMNGNIIKYNTGSRPRKYTEANIVGKEISANWLTVDLEDDLLYLVKLYNDWTTLNLPRDDEEYYQKSLIENIDLVIDSPVERADAKDLKPGAYAPIRSIEMGTMALINSNFQCEFDNDHASFKWKNGHYFMGKHHLIPMQHYLDYKLDIDHPYNIYCLCPNCHRRIQCSNKRDKNQMISHLYNLRKDNFLDIYKSSLGKIKRYYS